MSSSFLISHRNRKTWFLALQTPQSILINLDIRGEIKLTASLTFGKNLNSFFTCYSALASFPGINSSTCDTSDVESK